MLVDNQVCTLVNVIHRTSKDSDFFYKNHRVSVEKMSGVMVFSCVCCFFIGVKTAVNAVTFTRFLRHTDV